MEKNTVCLRKGAWSKEEDILLTKCIEKYGEGKWHLVPPRAGLNRCRKSCRLRWLNYLSPNIKRGSFAADEIDLIVRLHKLLGNRWSLIAGRIPGRTANDVKNFWNTYTEKKRPSPPAKITKSNIIKPRPRVSSSCKIPIIAPENEDHQQYSNNINYNMQSLDDKGDACVSWWSTLLRISENVNGAPFLFPVDEGPQSHNQPNNLANVDGVWEFLSMDINYSSNECFPPGLL